MKKQESLKNTITEAVISLVFIIFYGWLIPIFWNELMPHIFSLPLITYQQGILIAAGADLICFNIKQSFK